MIKRTLFFGNPAYLSTKDEQLLVTYPNKSTKPEAVVPIEDLGIIVLEHPQITITSNLIARLVDNKTVVITCGKNRMPTGLLQPLEGHTEQTERIRKQLAASTPLKKNLWQQTIIAKIENQAAHLKRLSKENKKLIRWSKAVKSGDTENHEAIAAAYYFQHLFDIDGFSRNEKTIPPNNLLNYGYAILRALTARAIVGSGLLPTVGIFHKSKYNAFCLADDIMEPYRPFVDLIVAEIVQSTDQYQELSTAIKKELLQVPVIDVMLEDKKSPLMVAMSRTTNSLYECFAGKSRKLLFPRL